MPPLFTEAVCWLFSVSAKYVACMSETDLLRHIRATTLSLLKITAPAGWTLDASNQVTATLRQKLQITRTLSPCHSVFY